MNSTKRNENDGEAGGGTMQPLKYLAFLKTVEYGSFYAGGGAAKKKKKKKKKKAPS
ncbi:MAG: hypothetical protein V8S89_06725 [Oscillospiraceae bacterium]